MTRPRQQREVCGRPAGAGEAARAAAQAGAEAARTEGQAEVRGGDRQAGRGARVRPGSDSQRSPDNGRGFLRVLSVQNEVQTAWQCKKTYRNSSQERETSRLP